MVDNPPVGVTGFPGIDIDITSSGEVFIAYEYMDVNGHCYLHYTHGTYEDGFAEPITIADDYFYYPDIEVDEQGGPHIIFAQDNTIKEYHVDHIEDIYTLHNSPIYLYNSLDLPCIGISSSGLEVAVWPESLLTDGLVLYWAYREPSATQWTLKGRVSNLINIDENYPSLHTGENDVFYLVWQGFNKEITMKDVYFSLLDFSSASQWTSPEKVAGDIEDNTFPVISMLNGGFYAAWGDQGEIYISKRQGYNQWSERMNVSNSPTRQSQCPYIAQAPQSGLAYMIWEEEVPELETESYYLYEIRFEKVLLAPEVTLIQPNGGEKWEIGKEYDIRWDISNHITQQKLEYTTDNGVTWLGISLVTT